MGASVTITMVAPVIRTMGATVIRTMGATVFPTPVAPVEFFSESVSECRSHRHDHHPHHQATTLNNTTMRFFMSYLLLERGRDSSAPPVS
jgi:hypothetical protein